MARLDEMGGPAFPILDTGNGAPFDYGMTLRDYFAAKAMQGLMSCELWNDQSTHTTIAEEAYSMADAMLAARGD